MEWVLEGEGVATEKMDGSCCAIIGGVFYKCYDAKRGKTPPAGAIPCCEPDTVTGHWPHWVKVNPDDRGDMWHMVAYQNSNGQFLSDGTYEVVGPHFRNSKESKIICRSIISRVLCSGRMENLDVRSKEVILGLSGTK